MKSIRRYMFSSLALALLALTICTGPVNAQQPTGKFRLPFDAQWGLATLPAGDYSFRLDLSRAIVMLHLMHDTKAAGMVIAQSYVEKPCGHSTLVVVEANGVRSVRELRLAGRGLVLTYAAHKPKRGSAVEERASLTIPVDWTGARQ